MSLLVAHCLSRAGWNRASVFLRQVAVLDGLPGHSRSKNGVASLAYVPVNDASLVQNAL
jgi:hypothetical protein